MADEDKIRVLIVDDIAETRENIRKLLQFEGDIEVVGGARTGREGIEMARKYQPNVILMDINMPDMDGIEATEHITREVKVAQIVILSVQNEPDYMRRAMVAGARDFLTKPPNTDELIATIRRMNEYSRAVKAKLPERGLTADAAVDTAVGQGVVITVYSPKGGVGCTTIASNLVIALKRQKSDADVLIIDGNLQFGDVGVFMNKDSKLTFADVAHLSVESPDIDFMNSVLVDHDDSGVNILLSPMHPEDAEAITGDVARTTVITLQSMFDYIVIDTGSNLTDVLLTFFELSDRIVLVTTPDIPAIAGARKFFELTGALGYPEEHVFFVVNRVDKRGISPKNIGSNLKHDVRGEIPFDHYGVLASINRGVPIMLNPKANSVAAGIYNLAKAIVADLKEPEPEPVKAKPERSRKPKREQKKRLFGA